MNNNIITYDLLIWIGLLITIISQILVSASYSRFKKKLNNKDITGFDAARKILDKNDLKDAAGISAASIAKLGKGANITTDVLLKICEAMDCKLEDIMETIKDWGDANES